MQACIQAIETSHAVVDHGRRWSGDDNREERAEGSLGRNFDYSKSGGMLSCAVEIGDTAVLSCLIRSGNLNPNPKDARGRTPLYIAAKKGDNVVVRMLLEGGADIDAQNGHNGNALQAALAKYHKEIVMLLLEKGANVKAQGGAYGNALHAALARSHREIMMLLQNHSAPR